MNCPMKYLPAIYDQMMKQLPTFILLLWAGILQVTARDIPARPVPPRLVNDLAGVLSTGEQQRLEEKLVEFDRSSSTQIAIVILPGLYGYDAGDLAFRIGEEWGVGQKEFDNGFVILVKPKIREESGRVFIATGYGVEEFVPDAVARRIIEVEMIPMFREEKYYEAIDKATDVIISLTQGEFTPKEYMEDPGAAAAGFFLFLLFIAFFIFFFRSRRARYHPMGKNLPFWTALFLLGASGGSHKGHFGSFSSGSGSFGSPGGFGGFGGGSFGGGGAGGRW